MTDIARFFSPGVVITANSSAASTSRRIPFGRFSGGGVLIGNTNGVTQISWHGSAGPEDTPLQIYANGAAVTTAVVVGAHPIPDACFGMHFVTPIVVGGTTCAMTVMCKG